MEIEHKEVYNFFKEKKSLRLIEHHDNMMCGHWRHSSMHSASTVDGNEWSASRLVPLNPGRKVSGTQWIEDGMGPSAVLDIVMEKIILVLA
jgi:hypothetical protein